MDLMKHNNTFQSPSSSRKHFELLRWQFVFLSGVLGLYLPLAPLTVTLAVFLLLLFALPQLRTSWGVPLAIVCCISGALLGTSLQTTGPDFSRSMPAWMQTGEKVDVHGKILEVTSKPDQRLRLILTDVTCTPDHGTNWKLPARLVLTWIQPPVRPVAGQQLRTKLRIRPIRNFGNSDGLDVENYWMQQGVGYRAYLYRQKEKSELLPDRTAYWHLLRNRLMDLAIRTMGGEQNMTQGNAVLFAMMFGERHYISPATALLLRNGSLAHSLALSGLHVGFAVSFGALCAYLITWIFPGLMLRIPRTKLAMSCGLVLAIPYVWLGNATPSLLRAFFMFLVWTVLLWRGSPRVLLDGLFIALLILLLMEPRMAFDLRLQLSAGAVAGIACFIEIWAMLKSRFAPGLDAPDKPAAQAPLQSLAYKQPRPPLHKLLRLTFRRIAELLGISLAAQLATLPLVIAYFGVVPINPLPNLIWLPLLFVTLPCGFCALLVSAAGAQQSGFLLMQLVSALLDNGLMLLEQLQNWHLQPLLLCLRPLPLAWAGYWGLLICAVMAARRLLAEQTASLSEVARLRVLCLCSTALIFAPAIGGLLLPQKGLNLTLLDVGQGQSILLETPAGKRLLIDGGGMKSRTFDVGEAVIAPLLTHNHAPAVDYVVYTHPDNDHLRGLLFVLSRFKVSRFATNGCLPHDWNTIPLARTLQQQNLRPEIWLSGQRVEIEPGLLIEVIHPHLFTGCADSNNASLCLRIVWEQQGLALITGDLEKNSLLALTQGSHTLASQILILPHHGAQSALCRPFYRQVAPLAALCSCGFLNQFHFPHPEVQQALAEIEIPLFCTAAQGALSATWSSPTAVPVIESVRNGTLAYAAGYGQ